MIKEIKIDLTYQPELPGPPIPDLYARACSGDGATVAHWKDTWLKNFKATKERFGTCADKSIGKLHNSFKRKPAICIGSGPSLKDALEDLKENQAEADPVLTISCLHNFGYFEDNGIVPTYYLSLDAGPIVLSDVFEGREHPADWYWERTAGKTLIAHVCTDPALFDKWKGNVYLFNAIIPDANMMEELKKIEEFKHYLSCGGNALGACMYFAKTCLGCGTIIYVGADFCFSYDNVWHSYPTATYDKLGGYVLHPDVFGVPRKTWQSYLNFKFWFDHVACTVPGEWINASQGLLGAYLGGNIKQYRYMTLKEALRSFHMSDRVFLNNVAAGTKEKVSLEEMWKDPHFKMDLTIM